MNETAVVAAQDGLINFYKPTGITSAKALYKVRSITGVRKSGHAGSLDPAADGVLILCLGRGTKLVERIMDLPKQYRATARLDVTSKSYDSDSPLEPVEPVEAPSLEQIGEVVRSLEGSIEQVPPRVSAIKLGGVPAYKTVGRADAPPMKPRRVRVYWIRVHGYAWPEIEFEVSCGRGTYIRALIRDLGARLNVGGCLTSLRRTAVGPFATQDAWTLERMGSATIGDYLIPLEHANARIEASRENTSASTPQSNSGDDPS